MAAKPKARKAAPKARDADDQKKQSAWFLKAARDAGVDESGKEFDAALKRITRRQKD